MIIQSNWNNGLLFKFWTQITEKKSFEEELLIVYLELSKWIKSADRLTRFAENKFHTNHVRGEERIIFSGHPFVKTAQKIQLQFNQFPSDLVPVSKRVFVRNHSSGDEFH